MSTAILQRFPGLPFDGAGAQLSAYGKAIRAINYELRVGDGRHQFFSLVAARIFARRIGGTIRDYATGVMVSVEPPDNERTREVLSYNGKAEDAPDHLDADLVDIRRRAIRLSGKRTGHSPQVIADARREWLENQP